MRLNAQTTLSNGPTRSSKPTQRNSTGMKEMLVTAQLVSASASTVRQSTLKELRNPDSVQLVARLRAERSGRV